MPLQVVEGSERTSAPPIASVPVPTSATLGGDWRVAASASQRQPLPSGQRPAQDPRFEGRSTRLPFLANVSISSPTSQSVMVSAWMGRLPRFETFSSTRSAMLSAFASVLIQGPPEDTWIPYWPAPSFRETDLLADLRELVGSLQRRGTLSWSPQLLALAECVAQREEHEVDIAGWAKRLADDIAQPDD